MTDLFGFLRVCLTYLKHDRVLIFLLLVVAVLVGGIALMTDHIDSRDQDTSLLAIAIVVGAALTIALFGGWMAYRAQEISQVRPLRECIDILERRCADLNAKLDAPRLQVITKRDYAQLIQKWNDSGEGYLLLWNIELQSFETDAEIDRTWGRISEMENVKGVILVLPHHKVRRWERLVLNQEDKFFAATRNRNRKFLVCEFSPSYGDGSTATAFALYRFGSSPGIGKLHGTALAFVLSTPFSELKDSLAPGDSPWYDYHHILCFRDDQQLLSGMAQAWERTFNEVKTRDVQRVLDDCKPLRPIEPAELFGRIGVHERRKPELLAHFQERRRVAVKPSHIEHDGRRERHPFTIEYDNGEAVQGHCIGVPARDPKPAIVWVGGFTERQATRLPGLFERVLNKEPVVQFFYQVSPPIEYITLTRYRQDMEEVLRYVWKQRVVMAGHIVLIARSINALLAPLVAAEDEFLEMLSGLILVAPVFDVVEMVDNYRTKGSERPTVRLEDCWRAKPGYTADKWEDPQKGWLEFYDHHISLTLFADIIRHDRDTFSIEGFKQAVGKVSQTRPVYVLANPDDPVTGSQKALEKLQTAAGGTGLIRDTNYRHVETRSSHLTVKEKDQYPFAVRHEARKTREAVREILGTLGLPVLTPQEKSAGCAGDAD